MSRVFIKNNTVCLLERFNNEPLEWFSERGWFIVNQKPDKNKLQEVVNVSHCWLYNKFYSCEYTPLLTKNID